MFDPIFKARIDQQARMVAIAELHLQQVKLKKQEDQLRRLFQIFAGYVGQYSQLRGGISVQNHFVTVDFRPSLGPEDTITVKLRSGNHQSKAYKLWIVGNITIIPLNGHFNSQLAYTSMNINVHRLLLFSDINGRIEKFGAKLENNQITFDMFNDNFHRVPKGSPIMTFDGDKPVVYSLKDHNISKNMQKWSIKPNLGKKIIKQMIDKKMEILLKVQSFAKKQKQLLTQKEQILMLEKELKEKTDTGSNLSGNIFQQTHSTSLVDGDHQQNKVHQATSIRNEQEIYKGQYNIDKAMKKFQLSNNQLFRDSTFLKFFVKRTLYNMKYVASWYRPRHLLIAISFKLQKDGSIFFYETVLCECGCKVGKDESERSVLHGKEMLKLASEKPLLFTIAALDAIIQMQEHSLIHNDISCRNFIYYQGDFLLGDFDMSYFVKGKNDIKFGDENEENLYLLNVFIMDATKYANKHQKQEDDNYEPNHEQVNLNLSSSEQLARMKATISTRHQSQLVQMLEYLYTLQQRYVDEMKKILQMIKGIQKIGLNPIKAYSEIIEYAQNLPEFSELPSNQQQFNKVS